MTLKQRGGSTVLVKSTHYISQEGVGQGNCCYFTPTGVNTLNLVANALWSWGTCEAWIAHSRERWCLHCPRAASTALAQEEEMNQPLLCLSQHLFSCQQAPGLACSTFSRAETPEAASEPKQANLTLPPSLLSSSPGGEITGGNNP